MKTKQNQIEKLKKEIAHWESIEWGSPSISLRCKIIELERQLDELKKI